MEQISCLQMRITQTATVIAIKLTTLQLPIKISADAIFYAARGRQGNFNQSRAMG